MDSNRRRTRRLTGALVTIAIGFAAIALVTVFNARSTLLRLAELKASDLRVPYNSKPSGAVVIAAIDDKSVAELGRWPWPRSVQARLVSALRYYKVGAVGFDLLFTEKDSQDVEREKIAEQLEDEGVSQKFIGSALKTRNDKEFADAIRKLGSVYLGYSFNRIGFHHVKPINANSYRTTFLNPPPVTYNLIRIAAGAHPPIIHAKSYLPPISELNSAARGVGFVNIDSDLDGTMRAYPLVMRFNGQYCVPLFLAVVDAFDHHAPLSVDIGRSGVEDVALGNYTIPVDEAGRMMVHFRGPPGTMPRYSIVDIIDHRVPVDALKGRIVFVGITAQGLGDHFVTPVGANFPGVEIQASAADTVLAGDFIRSSERTQSEANLAAWGLGMTITITATFLSALASLAIVVLLGVGYFGLVTYQLNAMGTLVPIVFPLLTLIVTFLAVVSRRYVTEGLEKRYLRTAFEHYLNPDVIASIVDDPDGLKLGGERRRLSILFADIVNFTSRAERTEPEPLVALLDTYMTTMTNVILNSGGVVDKLMGDGIMAFWGAPLKSENTARPALDCAIQMIDELRKLAATDDRFKDLDIGIGIATGDAVVGNFGGEKRFDYSVIGDTVNLASRIEGLTRQFKVHVLVNRETFIEAGGSYVAREIGLVKVKGKEQLVPVVDVVAHSDDGVDPGFYERFSAALGGLAQGTSPEPDLRKLLEERPNDRVTAMCLEKLEATNGDPPHEMVFEFDTK